MKKVGKDLFSKSVRKSFLSKNASKSSLLKQKIPFLLVDGSFKLDYCYESYSLTTKVLNMNMNMNMANLILIL